MMANLARVALALVLLVSGPGLLSARDESGHDPIADLNRAVQEAERALARQEFQIAESRYRTVLFEGWVLLGGLAERSGDLAGARSAYEAAIASAADVRRARIALARLLAQMEEFDRAEALLRLLIAQDKNDFEARRLMSDTLADAGRVEESILELEQLVSKNPQDLETAYYLATAYLAQERPVEAGFLLERLAEEIPTPQTHILIGRTYRDYKYFDRSRRAFEAALELDPRVPRANYYLGTVDLKDQGHQLMQSAIAYFERELEINPGEPMASLSLGITLAEDRRFEQAIPHLELASAKPELRLEASRFLGECLAAVGRTDDAIAALRRGLEAAEEEVGDRPIAELSQHTASLISRLHFQLGQALRRTGEREAAAVHFDAAKEYHSRMSESARETLSDYLANEPATHGRVEFAPPAADALEIDSEKVREMTASITDALVGAYLNLGVLEARESRPARAADLFQQAADLDPRAERVQYSLGVARFNAGQFEQAAEPLTRALEARPGDAQLQQMLALARFNSGDYAQAVEILERTPARSSDRRLQYLYGVALVRSRRAVEAETVFAELLERNADWPELNVVLAQAHAQQGDFAAAVALLERALALDPDVAEAHATLGEIHMRKGELAAAEKELVSELRAHPRDTRAMYTLATVLDQAQKPTEAMTLLESLLELEPRLGKARYLLGKILLAQGAHQDALEQLQAAVGLAPEDASIRYQLGQAYQKLGRAEEARREFDAYRQYKRDPG